MATPESDGRESEEQAITESKTEVGEQLLLFKEIFNFKKFVRDQLVPSESSDLAETVLSSARLIGQEKDGGFLFAWDTESSSSSETVTHVGYYSQASPAYRTLYKHECQADICAASVNFERTLLAFTTRDFISNEFTYDSYVAEIQPQGRIFTLNISGVEFRKLQFIHPEASSHKTRIGKHHQMSRLLVVIPEVYICMYQFRLQLVRLGAVMTQQPEQEVITDHFSWYQWDPASQWLYYARFETTSSRLQASLSGRNSLLLHCVSFTHSSHQPLLTVSLPLPYNEKLYSHSTTYYRSPLAFTAPIHEMNLQVLHRRDGFWCVCLQHCRGISPSSVDPNFEYEDLDTPQGSKIDYSVYIIHNGYVMYGQMPLPVASNEDMITHFMLIGCFIVAYIPGFMLHILNVGPRTDPCHHLAFSSINTPDFPSSQLEEGERDSSVAYDSPVLSSAVCTTLLGDYSTTVMECSSETVYECSLNVASFFELFKDCQKPQLMEDLMHLMVVGFSHYGTAVSMIEHVCQTPMRLVDHRLFAEFVLAAAFANVHYECKRYIAKQLPLTITPTFRGNVFKNESGTKLALLKLSPMPNFIKQLLVQSDQKLVSASPDDLLHFSPSNDQPFESLCFIAMTSQPEIPRLDIQAILAKAEATAAALSTHSPSPVLPRKSKTGKTKKKVVSVPDSPSSRPSSFIDRISTFTRRRITPSNARGEPQDMLPFLDCDEDIADYLSEETATVRENLVHKISETLHMRSRNLINSAVTLYIGELEKQSSALLLVIWQALGFNMDNHPLHGSLSRNPTAREHVLFELLEAYNLAHVEIGIPPPMGFHTLFICMGFRCLKPVPFLQYLKSGVFVPTKKFVELLLRESDNVHEQEVFHILSNLDCTLAEWAFRQWHNPAIELVLAHKN